MLFFLLQQKMGPKLLGEMIPGWLIYLLNLYFHVCFIERWQSCRLFTYSYTPPKFNIAPWKNDGWEDDPFLLRRSQTSGKNSLLNMLNTRFLGWPLYGPLVFNWSQSVTTQTCLENAIVFLKSTRKLWVLSCKQTHVADMYTCVCIYLYTYSYIHMVCT